MVSEKNMKVIYDLTIDEVLFDRLNEANGFDGGTNVMNSEDMGTCLQGKSVEDGSAIERIIRSDIQQTVNHRLAGDAYEEWVVREKTNEVCQMMHEDVILF